MLNIKNKIMLMGKYFKYDNNNIIIQFNNIN